MENVTQQQVDVVLARKVFQQALIANTKEPTLYALGLLKSNDDVAETMVLEIKILEVILATLQIKVLEGVLKTAA